MKLPLYIVPKKEFINTLNFNDPILKFLIEDNIVENERILIFEFPENFYFNLNYFDEQISFGVYKEFNVDLNADGSKRVSVIL